MTDGESENEFCTETLFSPNGEYFPSTSIGSSNFLTEFEKPREIKNDSWSQACMKVSTIFPKVDSKFIKETYIRMSFEENLRNEEDILQAVIEEVLQKEKKHTRFEISTGSRESKFNTDERIQYLLSIFPDANPIYLKTIASKNYDEPGAFEKFVEEKLETHDYPTKQHYVPVKNKKRIQKQEYVDSFNVEEFLERIPDPVTLYENPERKCTYDVVTFDILKNHFNRLMISTISEKYTRCSFNPLLAFEALQEMKPEMKNKRKRKTVKTENTQILQEFVFIKNRQRIKNYIKQKKEGEEKILQKMKDNNEFLECECCYAELPALSKYAITCQEGHVFCDTCLMRGTEAKLGDGVIRISCFAECTSEFNLASLQKVLKPATFKILLGKIQEQEIMAAKIEGLVSCPFCHFSVIPPENQKVFKCMNPDCGKESCRLCRKLNHLPKECEILEKSKKARLLLEEQMTAALVRKCGRCGKEFVKENGCNVVTCSCGATNCYFCGQLSTSYAHINGRCGSATNHITDAKGVVYVAKKIERDLLNMDPNLKISADSILPTIPGGSRYQNVEDTHVTAHALRAINVLPEL